MTKKSIDYFVVNVALVVFFMSYKPGIITWEILECSYQICESHSNNYNLLV